MSIYTHMHNLNVEVLDINDITTFSDLSSGTAQNCTMYTYLYTKTEQREKQNDEELNDVTSQHGD